MGVALEWACFYMWREEPALTDEQIVDFLQQQGWTWLVPGSHAGCTNKIPLGLSTWMNRILKTGTAVGRGTAGWNFSKRRLPDRG
eukprot:g60561.t1